MPLQMNDYLSTPLYFKNLNRLVSIPHVPFFKLLTTPNRLVILLLFTTFLISIFFYNQPKAIPPASSPRPRTPPPLPKCLQPNSTRLLRKNSFHISMVHQNAPSTMDYWVKNKTGFEIGGPSQHTWGGLGVYNLAAKVDVTNFASDTLWETGLKEGSVFMWNNLPKGIQYIRDAVDLTGIPTESYDFVSNSHVIEHIANPFKALLEWIRILRPGGLLMVIAPFKDVTFDHKREIDTIEHLIDDYRKNTTEADLSHLEEILRLHDLPMDPPAGGIETFRARSEKNFQNRGLHQHVYDQELLYYIYLCLDLSVKGQYTWGNSQLIIGQKK